VLQTAADADGDDGASGQTNSATVGTTAEPVTGPTVTNFSLANPTGRELRVSFDSSAVLADVGVAVTGPDTATLTTGAFNESDGTYTATVAVDPDGDYTATLFEATDGSGRTARTVSRTR